MEISDIMNGISIKVDEILPNTTIYTEKLEQGFTSPSVFIQFVNFEHIQQIGKRWKVTPMFNVQYFSKTGAMECANANLKLQQGLDDITLVDGVKMLARGARSETVHGVEGDVVGHNFMRFDFFLQKHEDVERMLYLDHYVNEERVNHIV